MQIEWAVEIVSQVDDGGNGSRANVGQDRFQRPAIAMDIGNRCKAALMAHLFTDRLRARRDFDGESRSRDIVHLNI